MSSLKISNIRSTRPKWIAEGEIDIEPLMSEAVLDEILAAFKKLEKPGLASVKQSLNYNMIRAR